VVARGQTITVTVTVKGGSGPVAGVALLDSDLRYQARPIASDGWVVVGAPKVIGPDGAEQTKWVDSRVEGLRKKGKYTIAAAFLYGTEKASAIGAVPQVGGGFLPRGGGTAPSGHMKFSPLATITVN
jgi:hypothetical protein